MVENRPQIPENLRRRVLVEAGHRCAIPTCRQPQIDVHHIIPWEKRQSHDFDNLIALCPNCHRRADRGEIDAKSLLLYKTQLSAGRELLHRVDSAAMAPDGTVIEQRWITNRIEESSQEPLPFEVQIEFPQFLPNTGEIAELNTIQQATALQRLYDFRTFLLSDPPPKDEWWADKANVLAASYEITLFELRFISIKYSLYHYGAGAAHGHHTTQTINYRRTPLIPVGLRELFLDGEELTSNLSAFCIKSLERENGDTEPNDWVRQGAAAALKNFESFNLYDCGVLITFDEYIVGPYAQGARQVYVPKDILKPYLRPNVGLKELWG